MKIICNSQEQKEAVTIALVRSTYCPSEIGLKGCDIQECCNTIHCIECWENAIDYEVKE